MPEMRCLKCNKKESENDIEFEFDTDFTEKSSSDMTVFYSQNSEGVITPHETYICGSCCSALNESPGNKILLSIILALTLAFLGGIALTGIFWSILNGVSQTGSGSPLWISLLLGGIGLFLFFLPFYFAIRYIIRIVKTHIRAQSTDGETEAVYAISKWKKQLLEEGYSDFLTPYQYNEIQQDTTEEIEVRKDGEKLVQIKGYNGLVDAINNGTLSLQDEIESDIDEWISLKKFIRKDKRLRKRFAPISSAAVTGFRWVSAFYILFVATMHSIPLCDRSDNIIPFLWLFGAGLIPAIGLTVPILYKPVASGIFFLAFFAFFNKTNLNINIPVFAGYFTGMLINTVTFGGAIGTMGGYYKGLISSIGKERPAGSENRVVTALLYFILPLIILLLGIHFKVTGIDTLWGLKS